MWDDRLLLVPIGRVDTELLEHLTLNVNKAISLRVIIEKPLPLPREGFDRARGQFLATAFFEVLRREDRDIKLGITQVDLYAPGLNFIFGQALLGARVAVVSLARLDNAFYGLPSNRTPFLKRMVKEVLHEMGHALGLRHCTNQCVMRFSNSIIEVDEKPARFCLSCQALLDVIFSRE